MTYFGLVLTPKNVNKCVKLFRYHTETLCEDCGIETHFQTDGDLHLTMAVLDIDYGAFIRRPMDWTFDFETPPFVVNNRSKFTLKIKNSKDDPGKIICHLHEGNKYQAEINLKLSSKSSIWFSCQQTCSIHLTGFYTTNNSNNQNTRIQ